PTIQNGFFHFEFRNAVAQKSADAVCAFEDRNPVPCLIELSCGSKPCRARPDDRHLFSRPEWRWSRLHPAMLKGLFDDRDFDLLDRDRIGVDAEHAGTFTGCGANPAGKLREIVRRVQSLDRFTP